MNYNNLIVRILSCEICGKPSESKNYNVVSCPGDKCRGCRFDKCLIEGMDPLMIKIDDLNCRNEFIEMLEKRRNKLQQTKSNDLYHQEDQETICVKNDKNFNEYKQSTSNQDTCISNVLCFNDTTIGIIFLSKKVGLRDSTTGERRSLQTV
uniref:Nuclear receptor domain-containing protein n=1 Tax=Meloidogyne incognita TaxID=6306 RepID=A0A914KQL9_MELIC